MGKEVFFADLRARNGNQNKLAKIRTLLKQPAFNGKIQPDNLTAIKIHFGEIGNDSFISPVFVREAVNFLKSCGGKPFVTDTNTLYSGSRHNAVDHLNTAIQHGFVSSVIDAPILIADGLKSNNWRNVSLPLKHFQQMKVAGDILDADSMLVMTHFKGHEMAGFGGAIKNLAMGCAPAIGKRDQHSTRQFVHQDQCIGCSMCVKVCPEQAAHVSNGKASINKNVCIGCGECMTVCPKKAIDLDWETEIGTFIERLTEYAYAAVSGKKGKVIYLNFLTNIVPDCDCAGWSDAPIVPDIGFLASDDPVAIDQASFDLVNAQSGFTDSLLCCNLEPGKDKFKGLRSYTQGERQLSYGEEIGMGTRDYTLIKL